MSLNGWLYRNLRAPRDGIVKVHLGPGQRHYIYGWINVDANIFTGKCDVWADLRNRLPFRTSTVYAMYSHHVIEHLPHLESHFAEVYRCLKPGGIYRVGGPNGDSAIRKFVANDKGWFGDWPDSRTSIGGRFANFVFCRGEHLTILTHSYLEEMMRNAGFKNIRSYRPAKETGYYEIFKECLEQEQESDFEYPHTLILEAEKPKKS